MKRSLASLATLALTFGLVSPVFASPFIRNSQPRVRPGAQEQVARASYANRANRNYVRARYNDLVRSMMPALLTVTGGNTDKRPVARPGTRESDNWTLDDHCIRPFHGCGPN